MKKINQKYLFINKTLFFPNEGILVIGDLHIGYEHLYEQSGLQISLGLTSQILDDLKKILNHIKAVYTLKKIVFIGDIKHYFNTQYEEKKAFFKILNLIEKYVKNPIYAGVICEKWTHYKLVKGRFNGLVDVDTFNQANNGKVFVNVEHFSVFFFNDSSPKFS